MSKEHSHGHGHGHRHLGKYELRTHLGHGGVAEVWKAYDTELQREVAIKVFHSDFQNSPDFLNRFTHEAEVITSLDHPNIAKTYEFKISSPPETENTTAYIVSQYIEGPTLIEYLHNTSRAGIYPPIEDVVHLFSAIDLALDYIHGHGLAHHAINPANIRLDQNNKSANPMGEPILTDVGIARLLKRSTGKHSNKPHYIAPEHVHGLPGDERSDIYSLGVILYELFTGHYVVDGNTPTSIMRQHIDVAPPPPEQFNPDITPELSSVIMRSLSKNPDDRYPTAAEMTAALFAALGTSNPRRSDDATIDPDATVRINQFAPVDPTLLNDEEDSENDATVVPVGIPVEEEVVETDDEVVETSEVEEDKTLLVATTAGGAIVAEEEIEQIEEVEEVKEEKTIVDADGTVEKIETDEKTVTVISETTIVDQPPASVPPPPPVTTTPPPDDDDRKPKKKRRWRDWLYILFIIFLLIIILLLLLARCAPTPVPVSGPTPTPTTVITPTMAITPTTAVTPTPTAVATPVPTIGGQVYFVNSGQISEDSSMGIADELQINLKNIPDPASGKSYYGWLLPDSDSGTPLLLGKLTVNSGNINYLFTGKPDHSDLIATYSRVVISENDATTAPTTLDKSTWKFSGGFSQDATGGMSELAAIRILLAADPKLDQKGLTGGLNAWFFRNVNKVDEWASAARGDWDTQSVDVMKRHFSRILTYIDGYPTVYDLKDLPQGATTFVNNRNASIPLVDANKQNDLLVLMADRLNSLKQVSSLSADEKKTIDQILQFLEPMRSCLINAHDDASKLEQIAQKNNDPALVKPNQDSQKLLNDLYSNTYCAFNGVFNVSTLTTVGGASAIYQAITSFGSFTITAYKA